MVVKAGFVQIVLQVRSIDYIIFISRDDVMHPECALTPAQCILLSSLLDIHVHRSRLCMSLFIQCISNTSLSQFRIAVVATFVDLANQSRFALYMGSRISLQLLCRNAIPT
jgi:hypothetical protein